MPSQRFLKFQECFKWCLRGQNLKKNPGHHGPEPHQKLAPAALAIQADGIKSY